MSTTTFAEPDDQRRCRCDNCVWEGMASQTRPIRDLWQRLDPGGTVPIGECPKCHALAYLDEDNEPAGTPDDTEVPDDLFDEAFW
jgi:hypothetical protein